MHVHLKPIDHQVMVITGATSGIGLATARLAAKEGARLVLTARSTDDLANLVRELESLGTPAISIPADVGSEAELNAVADAAIERFGRVDTWINNAGVSTYGKLEDIPLEDMRRVFDTTFWGVVHGSLAALRVMRQKGGAVINVGSIVSDRAIPLQGIYSAAKHAVKGFTDSFRMEVEEAGLPISVTLVKPASIDTPFVLNAKNYMDAEPNLPPPVYSPEVVARTILYVAEHPKRNIVVGGGGKPFTMLGAFGGRLGDLLMENFLFSAQKGERRRGQRRTALHQPSERGLQERGRADGSTVFNSSAYTWAALHPLTLAAGALALGGAASLLARNKDAIASRFTARRNGREPRYSKPASYRTRKPKASSADAMRP